MGDFLPEWTSYGDFLSEGTSYGEFLPEGTSYGEILLERTSYGEFPSEGTRYGEFPSKGTSCGEFSPILFVCHMMPPNLHLPQNLIGGCCLLFTFFVCKEGLTLDNASSSITSGGLQCCLTLAILDIDATMIFCPCRMYTNLLS